jgi:hypothetical protein
MAKYSVPEAPKEPSLQDKVRELFSCEDIKDIISDDMWFCIYFNKSFVLQKSTIETLMFLLNGLYYEIMFKNEAPVLSIALKEVELC